MGVIKTQVLVDLEQKFSLARQAWIARKIPIFFKFSYE